MPAEWYGEWEACWDVFVAQRVWLQHAPPKTFLRLSLQDDFVP